MNGICATCDFIGPERPFSAAARDVHRTIHMAMRAIQDAAVPQSKGDYTLAGPSKEA